MTTTDPATGAPLWLPLVNTVLEALEPFQEAGLAVSRMIQERHPEYFE